MGILKLLIKGRICAMQKSTLLIVEDEDDIRDLIAHSLRNAGYAVLTAHDGQEGFALAIEHSPQLILVDWMMPVVNGLELLRRLRRDPRSTGIPIIMLSAKAEVDNKAQGLDSGADDYLAKPFSPKELLSRIKAVLRRYEPVGHRSTFVMRKLVLDPESHHVSISGQTVDLGPTEFKLLKFFLTHPEKVYSREQLLDQVWGNTVYIDERTVDVHIRRLRKVLSIDGHEELIQTVRGTGYLFSDKR
jgi:two-component system phosphate regulon response regulator PhoB